MYTFFLGGGCSQDILNEMDGGYKLLCIGRGGVEKEIRDAERKV